MQLKGSMVALVTPMSVTGELDDAALERLIEWQIEAGTQGLVIAGTTGESPTLLRDEHEWLLKRVISQVAGRVPVVAGTGSNSTEQTLDVSRRAVAAGADALLLVTPYYNRPPQYALIEHYRKVAAAVACPILLYNVPSRTAVDLSTETVAELSTVENIVGIKEASGRLERVSRLRRHCGPAFILLSGDDATAADFMLAGGDGVVSVTANVVPERLRRLCDAARGGNATLAHTLDAELEALNRALFLETNPIPVKWALNRMGRIGPGIRGPLAGLATLHQPALEESLRVLGALA
ncbi:MAG: 4-hydroxy-tetrahydrodipicolinate synthase [Gammaproteobacteria bacterium]